MSEERYIKIFLASIKSDVTRKGYLENLERFRIFAKAGRYSDLIKMKKMKVQEIVEDYVLYMRENTHPNSLSTVYYPIQTSLR